MARLFALALAPGAEAASVIVAAAAAQPESLDSVREFVESDSEE